MAIINGSFSNETLKNNVTWTTKIDYNVDYDSSNNQYTVNLSLKAKRNQSGTSNNNNTNQSYATFTVNNSTSSQIYTTWECVGGATDDTLIASYYTTVSPNNVTDNEIPISAYWYTGLTSSSFTPKEIDVTGGSVDVSSLISACTAPTDFVVTPELGDNSFTLTWSGASGGTNNTIVGYDIQYNLSEDGTTFNGWNDDSESTIAHPDITTTEGSIEDPISFPRGYYIKYHIRTRGSAGENYYSGWKESNTVQRKPEINETCRIFNGNAFVDVIPYIFNGTKSVKTTCYKYNGSKWVCN